MATARLGSRVALAAVNGAAVVALSRVYRDGSFLLPCLGAVALAHAIGLIGTVRRWSLAMHEVAAGVGLVIYLAWAIEPSTTAYGLPLFHTFGALARDFGRGLDAVRVAVPPTAVTPGLLLVSAGGAFACAHLSDWAAHRLDTTIQPVVPPLVLFIVASALGTDVRRGPITALFVFTALCFLLVQSAALTANTAWAATPSKRSGMRLVVASGLPIAGVVGLAGLVFGPVLPGARGSALLSWKGVTSGGNAARQTISPLVDIRPRLTQTPVLELFTVRSAEPHNWRLTALDAFDGQHWTSVATYRPTARRLFHERDDRSPLVDVHQTYAIERLDSFWLPAAYRPSHITLRGARVNDASLTLLTDKSTAAGLEYSVDSVVPNPTPEDLGAVTTNAGFAVDKQLPRDFPPQVRTLAESITRTAPTPYAKARALQDYLRSHYTYNENVRPGHSDSALVSFLFDVKQGYCEQFAGAFAAMGRAVGLPTRVAVGFTPGRADGDVFHVETNNAHAWPEVHIAGYGWVPFEPTPGRFELTDGNHTGTFQAPAASATSKPAASTTSTSSGAADTPTTRPRDETGTAAARALARRHNPAPGVFAAVVVGALAVAGLDAVVVWLLATGRRARRRRGPPRQRIAGAWEEVVDRLDRSASSAPTATTPIERAAATAARYPTAADAARQLAALHTTATFGPAAPAEHDGERAWSAAMTVIRAANAADTRRERIVRWLDPRPAPGRRRRHGFGDRVVLSVTERARRLRTRGADSAGA